MCRSGIVSYHSDPLLVHPGPPAGRSERSVPERAEWGYVEKGTEYGTLVPCTVVRYVSPDVRLSMSSAGLWLCTPWGLHLGYTAAAHALRVRKVQHLSYTDAALKL